MIGKESFNSCDRAATHLDQLNHRSGLSTYLQDVDVGGAVGPVAAAVHLDVFQPLDVRLGVAVNLAVELHITAHHNSLIGRQPRLEDGPVGGTLCRGKVAIVSSRHETTARANPIR